MAPAALRLTVRAPVTPGVLPSMLAKQGGACADKGQESALEGA